MRVTYAARSPHRSPRWDEITIILGPVLILGEQISSFAEDWVGIAEWYWSFDGPPVLIPPAMMDREDIMTLETWLAGHGFMRHNWPEALRVLS